MSDHIEQKRADQAQSTALIRQLAAQGFSQRGIAAELNRRKVVAPCGRPGAPWYATTVAAYLKRNGIKTAFSR